MTSSARWSTVRSLYRYRRGREAGGSWILNRRTSRAVWVATRALEVRTLTQTRPALASRAGNTSQLLRRGLLRQRIRPHLELHQLRHVALADAFAVERRAVAGAAPDAAAFPAGVRVVDAAVERLGVEAHRIRHDDVDHLAVLERDQRLVLVAGRERGVLAETQRVMLVDPGVVARFRRAGARIANQLRARERIERPALGAMLAVAHGRPVEDLALAAVERGHVAAGERDPHHVLSVDIHAARAIARSRDFVDLSERRLGRVAALGRVEAHCVAREGERSAPHRAVTARRDAVERHVHAAVLVRVERLVRLGVVVTLAVAVGVVDGRSPALR